MRCLQNWIQNEWKISPPYAPQSAQNAQSAQSAKSAQSATGETLVEH